MKKMLFLLLAVMSAATMFAEQHNATVEPYLWRDGSKIYQGDNLLTKQEYKYLLQNTCPEAFRQYQTGKRLMTAGWSVFGVGAAGFTIFGLGGVVGQLIGDAINPPDPCCDTMPGLFWIGIVAMPIGAGVMLLSTPLLGVGYSLRNKSVKTYNQQCAPKGPAITYSITAGQNGLGFAINF